MSAWEVGTTTAIAFFAAGTFLTSSLFYWWTVRQRDPRPTLVTISGLPSEEGPAKTRPGEWLRVYIQFGNPGEVPIHVRSVCVMPADGGIAPSWEVLTVEERAWEVPPHGVATFKHWMTPQPMLFEKLFPEGQERRFEVTVTYLSGGRERTDSFGNALGITRTEGGGWRSIPHFSKRTARPW
jgi:hypothetical protein